MPNILWFGGMDVEYRVAGRAPRSTPAGTLVSVSRNATMTDMVSSFALRSGVTINTLTVDNIGKVPEFNIPGEYPRSLFIQVSGGPVTEIGPTNASLYEDFDSRMDPVEQLVAPAIGDIATQAELIAGLEPKAEKIYVDNELSLRDTEIGKKADKMYVDGELAVHDTQIASKADKTYVDTNLALKADETYVDTNLALKADETYVDTSFQRLAFGIDANGDPYYDADGVAAQDVAVPELQADGSVALVRGASQVSLVPAAKVHYGTKRSSYATAGTGDATAAGLTSAFVRYLVRLTTPTTRWRLKIRNYDCKNKAAGGNHAATSIYIGEHSLGALGADTGAFVTPIQVQSTAFAIPGDGSFYVSPWFDASTYQFVAHKQYVVGVGISNGASVNAFRGAQDGYYSTSNNPTAGATPLSGQLFDFQIEYEFSGDQPVGLFIGDSITAGMGGGAPYLGYPQQHAARSRGCAVAAGVGGSTSTDWAVTSSVGHWGRFDLANLNIDFAHVLLGANDITAAVPLATYQTNMWAIVQNIRAIYGESLPIYVGSVMPRNAGANESLRTDYNNWLRSVPMRLAGVFDYDRKLADPATPSALLAAYSPDGVHLTREGKMKAAEVIGGRLI